MIATIFCRDWKNVQTFLDGVLTFDWGNGIELFRLLAYVERANKFVPLFGK